MISGGLADNCLVNANASTNSYGAGIYIRQGGTAKNCTVVNNLGNTSWEGGGAGLHGHETGMVFNTTIAYNSNSYNSVTTLRNV